MKRLALAFACLISVAFFASCEQPVENPEPSIAILAEEGYVTDNAVVNLDEEFNFGFILAANAETQKDLKSLVIMCAEQTIVDSTITGKDFTYRGTLSFTAKEVISSAVIEAVVTDVDGQTATASINLSINKVETPLLSHAYEWVRRGSNVQNEEEMAALGLKWTGSHKEIFATWEPMDGYKLYRFDDAQWNEINFVEDKAALFNQALEMDPIESFRDITTAHSDDYDVILGTMNETEMNLIHVSHAGIETGVFGTQITVTGEVK